MRVLSKLSFIVAIGVAAALVHAQPANTPLPKTPADLYVTTRVWTVHLKFTADQWAAMEPRNTGQTGFRFQPPPGPSAQLLPAFVKDGDQDRNAALSRAEFEALGARWFADWDKDKANKVSADQLRAGLGATLAAAGIPEPRMPGFNLQGPEGKRNGVAAMMGIEFSYVHADFEFEGQWFKDVAVRYKGNGTFLESRGQQKRSLKIDLNEFTKGQKLANVSTLNLHSNITDPSSMNEVMAYAFHRDAGVPAPRTAYACVHVTVPGKHDRAYFGLYSLVENIDKTWADERLGTKKGALFKPVSDNLFADLGDAWAKYQQTFDPKSEVSEADARRVIELCKLISKADDAELARRLPEYIDLDAFARFMAAMVYLSDLDGILGPGQNFYLHLHPKTHKFSFIPWDQDHSWGQFAVRGTQEQREQLSIRQPWQGDVNFLERVFKVEAFYKLYVEKLGEFSKSICDPARLHKQVDEIAAVIRPAIKDESAARLKGFDSAVAGEPIRQQFGGFGGFGGQPLKPIKPFVTIRTASVIEQVAGKSKGQVLASFGPPRGSMGMFLGNGFIGALDADRNQQVTREEFTRGLATLFANWDTDKNDGLSEAELKAGIDKDLNPFRAPPGGPGSRTGGPQR